MTFRRAVLLRALTALTGACVLASVPLLASPGGGVGGTAHAQVPEATTAPSPGATSVTVTNANNGDTVLLAAGQRLIVDLAAEGDVIYQDARSSDMSVLFREHGVVNQMRSQAEFTARRDGTVDVTAVPDARCLHTEPSSCAIAQFVWQVEVVIAGAGEPAPSGSPRPTPLATATPGTTVHVDDTANGQTVHLQPGQVLSVYLRGEVWSGPTVTGRLFRKYWRNEPVATHAQFEALANETTVVTATRRDRCGYDRPACGYPTVGWYVCLVVGAGRTPESPPPQAGTCWERLVVSAPRDVTLNQTVAIRGTGARAGSTVRISFRRRGESSFTVRRTLTAAADGTFATSYVANDDYRYFATTDAGQRSNDGLTQVQPRLECPGMAARGSTVRIVLNGPPFVGFGIHFVESLYAHPRRRAGTLPATGRYATTFVADRTYEYYAITGPAQGRMSNRCVTRVL